MAWMGWCGGLLVVVYALTACGSDERVRPGTNGSGGTDPQGQGGTDPQGLGGTDPQGQGGTDPQGQGGTDPQGQGGTDPQGQGGTDPQGQGGSNPQGQGGTDPQGQGGTDPQGQGGSGGDAGNGGAGGDPGSAGAAGDPGAGGSGAGGSGAGGSGAGGSGAGACEDGGEAECEPCGGPRIHVECDERCVCEAANEPLKPTHEELLACDLDEPCPPSVRHEDESSALWTGGACLLTAFRDRNPGKYHHSTTLVDVARYTTDYTILVGEGGRVIVVRTTTSGPESGNLQRTYFPVWSCSFQNFEFLDACLAAGTNVSDPAVCDSIEDWFDDCDVIDDPECPSE